MAIRIIAVPGGDPPLEIRQEWVGLVLPTESDTPAPAKCGGLVDPTKLQGEHLVYRVPAAEAFRILGELKPEILKWWQSNARPFYLLSQRQHISMLFDAEVCEVVAEEPAVPA